MGWRLDFRDEHRTHLDFTGEEIERVGVPWGDFDPLANLAHARALLRLWLPDDDIDRLTVGQFERLVTYIDDNDLPVEWQGPDEARWGLPSSGGRWWDQWTVWCAHRFGWPPDVTKRQSLRDLRLLNESEMS